LQAIALSDPARGAHITRIWAASVLIEIQPMPAPNGGSGAADASSLVTSCDQAGQLGAVVVAVLYACHPMPERRK
jgi:hypothetical protein